MEVALAPIAAEFGAKVKVLDVDATRFLNPSTTNWYLFYCTAKGNSAITSWMSLKPVSI
jgi:hypothetical protein